MKDAPLYNDLAEGPEGGYAWWMQADDGVHLRAACWPGGKKGTIFMLPGRTEYIEKYGRVAAAMVERDYTMVTIDWRGQGLSDRLARDPMLGHVRRFRDYQRDLRALIAEADAQKLPRPYYMIAHSMGGCIGLRALHDNLPFQAAVFSGPMWGIQMAPHLRPFAWVIGTLFTALGLGHVRVFGTSPNSYVLEEPFETNELTSDRGSFEYMQRQTKAISGVGLGGPSLQWLITSLIETRKLRAMLPPDHPAMTFLGTDESIVDPRYVREVMGRWVNGVLVEVEGGRHEIPMETPQTRAEFFDAATNLFDEA